MRFNFQKFSGLITIILLLMVACDGPFNPEGIDNILDLSKDTITLSSEAGSSTIQVNSTGSWTVETDTASHWLSVSALSGTGAGSFRAIVTANNGQNMRQSTIKVSQNLDNNTLIREVIVRQLGSEPSMVLDYPTDIVSAIGTELRISIISNVEWDAVLDDSCDWISITETGTDYCKIHIDTNTNVARVSNVAIVARGDFYLTKFAEIRQEASTAELNVMQDEFAVPYKNQIIKVPIELGENFEHFKVISNTDWIVWDEANSTKNLVVLNIKDNDVSDFPREAEVTFNNVVRNQHVRIFQYGKPNPRIGDDLSAGVLAFPGAEGGGRFTTGGRGGKVYIVTRLDDYASGGIALPGTIRYAVEQTGVRTVVFGVSGTIELKRPLDINHGNISILGQTAPGDGITLKNYDFHIEPEADNVIIRYLRIRPGDQMGVELDAMTGRWFKTGIVDHVSGSWSVDECLSFYGVKDFTLQWSISAESLNNSVHSKGPHGYGAMFSGDNSSFHHIMLAHHASRMPRISALDSTLTPSNTSDHQGFSDIRNIVAYNWYSGGMGAYGGEWNPFNWVNQYYKAGPATGTSYKSWRLMAGSTTSKIFAVGSVATANVSTAQDNWKFGIWDQMTASEEEKLAMKMSSPHPYAKVTTHTAEQAYEKVAAYAGASLRRDLVDKRYINEMLTGTTTYVGSVSGDPGIVDNINDVGGRDGAYPALKSLPSTDSDKDGIPDDWEIAYGLNTNNANDALQKTIDQTGRYSNLEVYFCNLVQHITYYQNLGGTVSEKN